MLQEKSENDRVHEKLPRDLFNWEKESVALLKACCRNKNMHFN